MHVHTVSFMKKHGTKSARQKQRDTDRMTAFVNRKTAECLPFYNVDTACLRSQTFNSIANESYQMEIDLLARLNLELGLANSTLKEEVRELNNDNKELSNSQGTQREQIDYLNQSLEYLNSRLFSSNADNKKNRR